MLALTSDQVTFIIQKAREFDVKVEIDDPDSGSNASDDGMLAVLEESADDPSLAELTSFLNALNEDGQVELVALAWLGRGDEGAEAWDELIAEARRAHNDHTAGYLLGMPLLSDYLEEGVAKLEES
ncbi:MAG: DUF3775 domain-containing protein [Alphaproteobacteria bacterium]